jgi:hypothetical protein
LVAETGALLIGLFVLAQPPKEDSTGMPLTSIITPDNVLCYLHLFYLHLFAALASIITTIALL